MRQKSISLADIIYKFLTGENVSSKKAEATPLLLFGIASVGYNVWFIK
jgi:hypothetical protein